MKKLLSFLPLLLLIIALAACGSDDQASTEKEPENKEETEVAEDASSAEKQAAYMEDQQNEEKEAEANSSDEVSNDEYSFEGELGTYNMVGMYHNDETFESENGTNSIDFDGFNIEFVPTLVDIELNEEAKYDEQFEGKESVRAIMMAATAENTNDFEVDYNGGVTVVTDTKEQLSSDSGVFSSNPIVQNYMGPVIEDGMFYFFLKDQESEPKHLKVMFEPPYKVEDGAVDPVNGVLGEEEIENME
jgi:hypothetical protein